VQTELVAMFAHRAPCRCLVLPCLLSLVILIDPQPAVAGAAWDVIRYNPSSGVIVNDSFAFEAGDPYQGHVYWGPLFAGACQPIGSTTCYPMWSNPLTSGSPGGGWTLVGAADFDLNGTTDLVFQNPSTGAVSVTFFQGTYSQSFLTDAPLSSPLQGWNVEAIGDLNGDGCPDILYFNPTTGARQVYFYAFAPTQVRTCQSGSAPLLSSIPATQHVVAIADFNLDGQADLITQSVSTGNVKVHYLSYIPGSGFSITSSQYMNSAGSPSQVVIGAADADGTGYPDLFYMNTSTGEVFVDYFYYTSNGPQLNYGSDYSSDVEYVNPARQLFIARRVKQPAQQQPNRILLYIGSTVAGPGPACPEYHAGVSVPDYFALQRELDAMGLRYDTATYDGDANTINLNAMTQAQFNAYAVFIVPGGNTDCIVGYWTQTTKQMIQNGVLHGSVSYLGFCAGAFVAGYRNPALNLTGLPIQNGWDSFNYYSLYYHSQVAASLEISLASGPTLEMFWDDGPQLSGFGDTIATYPDGTPAISETSSNGFVILSGVHPEATADWMVSDNLSPVGSPFQTDFAFAASLINAAVTKTCILKGQNCP
jgi:FG-GAP-like repeat